MAIPLTQLFIKQAIHFSEPYGTEAVHYIIKLTLYLKKYIYFLGIIK